MSLLGYDAIVQLVNTILSLYKESVDPKQVFRKRLNKKMQELEELRDCLIETEGKLKKALMKGDDEKVQTLMIDRQEYIEILNRKYVELKNLNEMKDIMKDGK